MTSCLTSLLSGFVEDTDAIGVDIFEDYVKKMHVDGDFGFAQLYEVSFWTPDDQWSRVRT